MFGSTILETAIGLVFVYLFLSILVSAANEGIAALLGWRAQTLGQGLRSLFNGTVEGEKLLQQVLTHPLIKGLSQPPTLLSKIPLVKNLVTDGASYIPSKNFSLAVLDTLLPERLTSPSFSLQSIRASLEQKVVDPQLRQSFQTLLADAGNQLPEFGNQLENWFNTSMDRVSGWYKRKVMLCSFLLGILVSVALNADTLGMINRLYHDSGLRLSLNQAAQAAVSQAQPPAAPVTGGIPAGAVTSAVKGMLGVTDANPDFLGTWTVPPAGTPNAAAWWLQKVLGLLLTALAVTLGAPFWFDLLGKLVPLRGSGPEPASPKPAN